MSIEICRDRQSILEANGHVLVTGGPGSGKTTIALLKARRQIESGLLLGQSVLFLSFSRAAVGRAVEACKTAQIPAEVLRHLSIQTFHSFFWEVLRAYGYLLGAPKQLRLILPHDEAVHRNGQGSEDEQWQEKREKMFSGSGLVVFDLFAPKVHLLLCRSTRLRTLLADRHPLIVVDEAQDTADDQWQILRHLAGQVQLICLADLEQQIYDFRPGVSSERVKEIMEALSPLRVDFKGQNHRSPTSEIVTFGNDILLGTPRGGSYRGVSRYRFQPRQKTRDQAIRSSIGMVINKVERETGSRPESIAVLASWGRGVSVVSRALTGDGSVRPIVHKVNIDEAAVLLSSRLVALLLEPRRDTLEELKDLGEALDLIAAVFRSKGTSSGLDQAERIAKQASEARAGRGPRRGSVGHNVLGLLGRLRQESFSGDPRQDWLSARKRARECGVAALQTVAEHASNLIVFQRGHLIASGLKELWQSQGTYAGARQVLDAAITQDQLLSGGGDLKGIHVMTLHKAKGKEFDAVVILDDANICPLILRDDGAPHPRSRKLLRVGITRAKHHVLLLTDMYNQSVLLAGHVL